MTSTFYGLLAGIAAAGTAGAFRVLQVPGLAAYYLGRNHEGSAALLIRAAGPGPRVPMHLAGIEAWFSMPCRVAEVGGKERTENLTAIVCASRGPGIETYFASAMEMFASVLGDAPTLAEVANAVDQLVELFQRLRQPQKRSIAGLVGELLVIRAAADATLAVQAWRADTAERFDFAAGNLRLEAKASSGQRRIHDISFDQANPPPGTIGLLASLLVPPSAGGSTFRTLVAEVEARLATHEALLKLRFVLADTLGQGLLTALSWSFDLHHAASSLRFYDLRAIPAIRPPLPAGVSGVRFGVEVDGCRQVHPSRVQSIDIDARGLLPA